MVKPEFEQLEDGIFRLCVPFHNIYTSVFLLVGEGGTALLDCATTDEDVENFIAPALEKLNTAPDYLIISHFHSDHAGGLAMLMKKYPNAVTVCFDKEKNPSDNTLHPNEGNVLLGHFEFLNFPGHTADALAVLDRKTNTLISCDCLQMYGVSAWGVGADDYAAYMQTLERVGKMKLSRIIAAHDYYPLGYSAVGETEIFAFLLECKKAVEELSAFIDLHSDISNEEIARLYCEKHPELPKIYQDTIYKLKSTI